MKLNFTITTDQLKKLAERIKSERIAKEKIFFVRLHVCVVNVLFLWFPILSPVVLFYFFGGLSIERFIAIAVCSLVYFGMWKFKLKSKIDDRIGRFVINNSALDSAIGKAILRRLESLKGSYVATISPDGLTLSAPRGKCTTIPWSTVCHLREDEDFYHLMVCKFLFFKVAHLIAKNGDEKEVSAYQAGLEYMISLISIHAESSGKSQDT